MSFVIPVPFLVYGGSGTCLKTGAFINLQDKTNTECLLKFLPELNHAIKPYSRRPVYLVFDNHASHHTKAGLWKMQKLGFQPLFIPSCSSWFSSVETLWAVMKVNVRRHLSVKALRTTHAITMDDLRECIKLGFEDITEQQRLNLVKANHKDLLS